MPSVKDMIQRFMCLYQFYIYAGREQSSMAKCQPNANLGSVCEIKHELRTLGLHVILIFLHALVVEGLSCGLAQNFPGFVR